MTRAVRFVPSRRLEQDTAANDLFTFQLRALSTLPQFEREFFFASEYGREFRWDFAFLPEKLAIEINGGIWVKGAHAHPTTILRNMEKLNHGAYLGWRVLAFTPEQVENGQAVLFTEAVIKHFYELVRAGREGIECATTKPPALSGYRNKRAAATRAYGRSATASRSPRASRSRSTSRTASGASKSPPSTR